MPSLIMLSPAPLIERDGGEIILDVRFVEGMKLHCQLWPGPVRVVLHRGRESVEQPMRYAAARLGFDLIVLDRGQPVPDLLLEEAALIYAAADDMQYLNLPNRLGGRMARLVFTVDDSLPGRLLRALGLEGSVRRKLGAAWWNLRHEAALRRALGAAKSVQCNGYPAASWYGRTNSRLLRFVDSRMRAPMMVRPPEQESRSAAQRRGDPLRLVWFGALTPDSGAADLLPMAHLLTARRVPFSLALWGDGPMEGRIRDGIDGLGLGDHVSLAPMPPFDPVLVPRLRREADVFILPRRLPTALSTYIEAMGCGLPVLGYANGMWRRMQRDSGAGWTVRRGSPGALADAVQRLHHDREAVIAASARAAEYARANAFEATFARRMSDLREVAGLD